jgi:two-component system NtrC family sensor kinase
MQRFFQKAPLPIQRKLFIVLFVMSAVPLGILLFGVVGSIEKDLEHRLSAELHDTLDGMTTELDTLIYSQKALAKGLAQVPAVTEFAEVASNPKAADYPRLALDLEAFFLDYQTSVPSIQALRFIDPTGKTLVKVKEGKEIPAKYLDKDMQRYYVADQSYKPFFKYALTTTQDVSLSDFELGQVNKEADFCPAMLRYSVPIRDEVDNFLGLLVVNMWGKRVDATVEAALGGYPGNVYIAEINDTLTDRDGIFLYHQDTERRFTNQLETDYRVATDIGEDNWQAISRGGHTDGFIQIGNSLYFYKQYSPYKDRDSRWLLLIEADYDVVYAPIISLERSIWILMAILIVLSLLLANWVSARISRPVQNLANIITRYADGDENARVDEGGRDEVCAAGRAFNYLCDNLEHTRKERDKAEQAVLQSERLAAVGQLAAGIGHEINNPLMNMMSLADLSIHSLPESSDPQIRKDLQTLMKEGRRCSDIVQGILNFARENRPSITRFNLGLLLHGTINLIQHHFDNKGIRLETTIQDDLYMEGDENQIQQVLVNILLNAVHACGEGDDIAIIASASEDTITLVIEDNGSGIREEDLPRVFTPFYTTKPEGEGTGLGLSISYGIIRKHGGNIELENRDIGGVRVTVTLPVNTAQVTDDENEDEVYTEHERVAS